MWETLHILHTVIQCLWDGSTRYISHCINIQEQLSYVHHYHSRISLKLTSVFLITDQHYHYKVNRLLLTDPGNHCGSEASGFTAIKFVIVINCQSILPEILLPDISSLSAMLRYPKIKCKPLLLIG